MMKVFALILLSISLSEQFSVQRLGLDPNCGIQSVSREFNISEKIINGDLVGLGMYPWLVSIYTETESTRTRFCSGGLISDRFVLTAAHCTENRDLSKLRIGYGHTNFQTMYDNDLFIQVESVILNKDGKDIALFKLAKPVDLSNRFKVSTICLPSTVDTRVVLDKEVIVAGWGSTNGQKVDKLKTPDLLQAKLTVDGQCSIGASFYCLIDKNNDGKISNSCYGDSGTPAMFFDESRSRWVAYGILSMSTSENGICQPDKPSYYVKVPEVLRWIRETVSQS